jgi:hypothetical protein
MAGVRFAAVITLVVAGCVPTGQAPPAPAPPSTPVLAPSPTATAAVGTLPDEVLIVEVRPGPGPGEEAEFIVEQWIGRFDADTADLVGSVDTPAGRYELLRYERDGAVCVLAIKDGVGSGTCGDGIRISQTLSDPFAEGVLVASGEIVRLVGRTSDGHEIVGVPRRGVLILAWPADWGELVDLVAETASGQTLVVLHAR